MENCRFHLHGLIMQNYLHSFLKYLLISPIVRYYLWGIIVQVIINLSLMNKTISFDKVWICFIVIIIVFVEIYLRTLILCNFEHFKKLYYTVYFLIEFRLKICKTQKHSFLKIFRVSFIVLIVGTKKKLNQIWNWNVLSLEDKRRRAKYNRMVLSIFWSWNWGLKVVSLDLNLIM